MTRSPQLIAIMGPTGSGKTTIAEGLATKLDAQLVNADAFQIYRGLDIGTAKPTDVERYALLDIRDPTEPFSVGEWVQIAQSEIWKAYEIGRSVVVVGGTGLYMRALFDEWTELYGPAPVQLRKEIIERIAQRGLESVFGDLVRLAPEAEHRVDPKNRHRVIRAMEIALTKAPPLVIELPPIPRRKFEIHIPTQILTARIDKRTQGMLQGGWVEEVERLAKAGLTADSPGMRAIGYRTVLEIVRGRINLEEAIVSIQQDTHQYAKRQRTWLRSEKGIIRFESAVDTRDGEELAEAMHRRYFETNSDNLVV